MNEKDNSVMAANDALSGDSVYTSFSQAAANLAGLTAIDYFFAKEMYQSIAFSYKDKNKNSSQFHQTQWFHLLIALSASLRDGHSCLPLDTIANKRLFVGDYASSMSNKISDQNNVLLTGGFLFSDVSLLTALVTSLALASQHNNPIVFQHGCLYLRRYYQFEEELSQAIRARRAVKQNTNDNNQAIKKVMIHLFPDTVFSSQKQAIASEQGGDIDWQAVAVANAINKNFAIIAGGPGTGKTYTVTKLLAALVMLSKEKLAKQSNVQHKQEKKSSTALPRIALVAPTGKAAQRLSESIINAVAGFKNTIDEEILAAIPTQTQTLHRLLGVIPNQVNFRHHQNNLLPVDILLIDEVSMVDLAMMARVFRALPLHSKVILLGDADQLPSVAVGNVLADFSPMPHSGYSDINQHYLAQVTGFNALNSALGVNDKTPRADNNKQQYYQTADCVTFLTKSRRFDGEGGIGQLAKQVISGQYKTSWQLLSRAKLHQDNKEGAFEESASLNLLDDNLMSWLPQLVQQYYQPLCQCSNLSDAFALLNKFRILSPTRQGSIGVENINSLVIDILQQTGAIPYQQPLYATQPIMISENDYRLGLYNGDIGILWNQQALEDKDNSHSNFQYRHKKQLMAVFEDGQGGYIWILPSRLPKFETVYAMTIHKTQGSEFEHVVMVLPEQKDNRLLSRELLYTGITRAKTRLSIATNEKVWQQGVSQQVIRYSGLSIKQP